MAFVVGVVVILMGMVGYFWVYPLVTEWLGDDGGDGNQNPGDDVVPDDEMDHSIGSGAEDWWKGYPAQNALYGSDVPHLDWVLDEVAVRPVLLFVHSTTCVPCNDQSGYIAEALDSLDANLLFEDVLADGTNPLGAEIFGVYDPNGAPNYIPLTVIATLTVDANGDDVVVWHSVEGSTSVEWLLSYLGDALMYYE